MAGRIVIRSTDYSRSRIHSGAPRGHRDRASSRCRNHPDAKDPGDSSGEATPVPIPNTEVKLSSAEDTERAAFRENRSSPGFLRSRPAGARRVDASPAGSASPGYPSGMTAVDPVARPAPPASGDRTPDAAVQRRLPLPRRGRRRVAELDGRPRASVRGRVSAGAAGRREAAPAVPDPRPRHLCHVRRRPGGPAGRPRSAAGAPAPDRPDHPGRPRSRPHRHRHARPPLGSAGLAGDPHRHPRDRLRGHRPDARHRRRHVRRGDWRLPQPRPERDRERSRDRRRGLPGRRDGRPERSRGPTPGSGASAGPSDPGASAVATQTYKVKAGDTLVGIAAKFGTTPKAIATLNGITDPTSLHAGQILKIP